MLEGVQAASGVHHLPALVDFIFLGEPPGGVEVEARCDEYFSEARVGSECFEVRLPEIRDGEDGCGALSFSCFSVTAKGGICRRQARWYLKSDPQGEDIVTVSNNHLNALGTQCFGCGSRGVASDTSDLVGRVMLQYRIDD